ncbi:MAG: UDP-N-acetylmuramoyl-L-alanine--D-glutamate ligase [Hyphomicrobiales bacterium]|nr:UDP-N-acetylmuramoyl-L-alanine--D-glutamate ligase [Hyphomicrobiales bacterium]MCP5371210.1 UDP-N-acetylmuramoyl-L-alanine--D-glutamate ligase [Hyphomicrobiales bacterium]
MIPMPFLANQTVAVFGLGRTGRAAAHALRASGARVLAWDDSQAAREAAAADHIPLTDLYDRDWTGVRSLVLSPGVPLDHPVTHPVVALARGGGCEVLSDIELLYRARPDAAFVGITGTNGKSTTTALVAHLLDAAGQRVEVGGNLGRPVLDFEPLGRGQFYVLEMSSYQLDLSLSLTFRIAVLLNISPDHLDRHGGMDGYVAAKKRLFHGQGADATAIVGIDDARSRALFDALRAAGPMRAVPVSGNGAAPGGVYALDGRLVDDLDGAARAVADLADLGTLRGAHNHQNAAAAYAAARAAGLEPDEIAAALATFPGLAHRQELVGEVDGVAFVNDSKATNPDAAAKALASYDAIYWIAGGRPKDEVLGDLAGRLRHVRAAFLIGEAAPAFAAGLAGHVPAQVCGTLEAAVAAAFARARRDRRGHPVVLLSPACASFDQFTDFEARGEAFRAAVESLAEELP